MLEKNGYYYSRNSGSHSIYINAKGNHISVPLKIRSVIARRLIKENNLKLNK
jgi:predicted RNA binding protein YcfA (HicA-like mRNA interferase family)